MRVMRQLQHHVLTRVLAKQCKSNKRPKLLMLRQMAKVSWFHAKLLEKVTARRAQPARDAPLPPMDPCIDNHLTDYLNLLSVQKAINAVPGTARQPVAWNECSSVVQYDFNSVAASVVPVLEKLFARCSDFHALVLSGDVDAIVPVSGTLLWIESLKRAVIKPWHVWYATDTLARVVCLTRCKARPGWAGGRLRDRVRRLHVYHCPQCRPYGQMCAFFVPETCSVAGAHVPAGALVPGLLFVAGHAHCAMNGQKVKVKPRVGCAYSEGLSWTLATDCGSNSSSHTVMGRRCCRRVPFVARLRSPCGLRGFGKD